MPQVQPVPDALVGVRPAGTVSLIVTVPAVAPAPELVTTIVYVAPIWPCVKLPACVLVSVRSAGATRHAENSDVLLLGSVAVDVITDWPPGAAKTSGPKLALQVLPVVTLVAPRKVCPSPFPEGSHTALEKNSTRKVVLAVLFKVPEIVALPPPIDAEVMTG